MNNNLQENAVPEEMRSGLHGHALPMYASWLLLPQPQSSNYLILFRARRVDKKTHSVHDEPQTVARQNVAAAKHSMSIGRISEFCLPQIISLPSYKTSEANAWLWTTSWIYNHFPVLRSTSPYKPADLWPSSHKQSFVTTTVGKTVLEWVKRTSHRHCLRNTEYENTILASQKQIRGTICK